MVRASLVCGAAVQDGAIALGLHGDPGHEDGGARCAPAVARSGHPTP